MIIYGRMSRERPYPLLQFINSAWCNNIDESRIWGEMLFQCWGQSGAGHPRSIFSRRDMQPRAQRPSASTAQDAVEWAGILLMRASAVPSPDGSERLALQGRGWIIHWGVKLYSWESVFGPISPNDDAPSGNESHARWSFSQRQHCGFSLARRLEIYATELFHWSECGMVQTKSFGAQHEGSRMVAASVGSKRPAGMFHVHVCILSYLMWVTVGWHSLSSLRAYIFFRLDWIESF